MLVPLLVRADSTVGRDAVKMRWPEFAEKSGFRCSLSRRTVRLSAVPAFVLH